MTEDERKARNTERLTELYPAMARRVKAIIADLEGHGWRPRIQEAYRSPADQLKAFNTGHSKLRYGFHNVTGAGGKPEALAVDLLDDDHALNPTTAYLITLAVSARAHGCSTGLAWGLSTAGRKAVEAAIVGRKFDTHIPVGWDSCHCEISGATAQKAKNGWRPE